LVKLQTTLHTGVEQIMKQVFPVILRSGLETNISAPCASSFLKLVQGLKQTKQWAFRMVDSMGKPPSSILTGTLTDFGGFEECLAINVRPQDVGSHSLKESEFRGRYCIMDIRAAFKSNIKRGAPPPPGVNPEGIIWDPSLQDFWVRNNLLSFRYGLCIPSTCSNYDMEQFGNYVAGPSGMKVEVNYCQDQASVDRFNIDWVHIFILSIFGAIIFTVLIGTLIDIIYYKQRAEIRQEKSFRNFFASFSLYSNWTRLFAGRSHSNSLQALDGLRFFSVTWVILGHTYYYTDFVHYQHYRNLEHFQRIDDSIWFTPIGNFTLSVDTFFYISGFLVVYSTWKKLGANKGRLNVIDFVVHRVIFRLWPAYLVVIGLTILAPLTGSGPLWIQAVVKEAGKCRTSWWRNLLFINNFQLPDQICLLHSWYLSANMQFHLVAGLLLMILYWKPIVGIISVLTTVLAAGVGTFIHAWINDIRTPTLIPEEVFEDNEQHIMNLYVKPYSHIGGYLAGMIGGYIFLKWKSMNVPMKFQVFLWTLCLIGGVLIIISPHQALCGHLPTLLESSLYWATHRTLWALIIGWIVHASATGKGGIINDFLSHPVFGPLSNLSYIAYLIHPVLMSLHTGLVRERVNYGHYELMNIFMARMVMSFLLSAILYVAIEVPFGSIEKYILPKRQGVQSKKPAPSSAASELSTDSSSADSSSSSSSPKEAHKKTALESNLTNTDAHLNYPHQKSSTMFVPQFIRPNTKGSYYLA